jgi:four helix bundle protein
MFDFQKLEVYKKALIFHGELKSVFGCPGIHKSIADQLFRASLSITLNIAEGSGRLTQKDRRNFFIISRSSVFECVAILDAVASDQCFSQEQYFKFISDADEISRMLYAMIKNLEK